MAVRVKEDASYGLTHKMGTIDFDAGVRGPELVRELRLAGEKFIKDMGNRGLTLYQPPGGYLMAEDGTKQPNPSWLKYEETENQPKAYYAIDWEGTRKKEQVQVTGRTPDEPSRMIDLPTKREESLEDSEGMVEYRIVGIFWARKGSTEVVTDTQERLAAERAARHPVIFGPEGH